MKPTKMPFIDKKCADLTIAFAIKPQNVERSGKDKIIPFFLNNAYAEALSLFTNALYVEKSDV